MSVIVLSGPVGAGKTTVGRELLAVLPAPVSYIEGDEFWSFVPKPHSRDRREVFRIIMRSMTAAALPFARSGYQVILDFSVPPQFLETMGKILKDVPLHYIVLRPSLAVCEARAAQRSEGRIRDYTSYREFYALFDDCPQYLVSDDQADASSLAKNIVEDLLAGRFAVHNT